MLEIKKITKIYKTIGFEQKALDKVSVNFRESEFAAILGPSGSGKTTFLNIIGGLDKYDDGNLISILSPKSNADRKLQEDDICKRIKKQYPDIDENKFRAISISTALAGEAIADEDDNKFKDSRLDLLMKILGKFWANSARLLPCPNHTLAEALRDCVLSF